MSVPTTVIKTAYDSSEPDEYLIALVDVLGFGERVTTQPLQNLIREYERLLGRVGWSSTIPVFHLAEGRKTNWVVRSVIFSDSVLLWSKPEPEAIDMLLTTCARITAESAKIGWPLRGIVTIGETVINEGAGLFVGEAIVRAVLLEKAQEWVGFGLDDRLVSHERAGGVVRGHADFIEYDVPTKPGTPRITAALKWKIYDPWAHEPIAQMMERAPLRDRPKYQAALDFLNTF
jgi:hypothetical protein